MSESSELSRWKRIAAYLAECHAATAEELSQRAPKQQRVRARSICYKAIDYMSRGLTPTIHMSAADDVDHAIARCQKAAEKIGQ